MEMEEEKKVKKKLSKKNIFFLIMLCIILIVITILVTFFVVNRKKIEYYGLSYYLKYKSYIDKGYKLYGFEDCEGHSSEIELAGMAETAYICEICGQEYINSTTKVPKICSNCSKITNRCQKCGNFYNITTTTFTEEQIDESDIEKIEYYGQEYYLKYEFYIDKGYELYGDDEGKEHDWGISVSLFGTQTKTCQICGEEFKDPHGSLIICSSCASITNRCRDCGILDSTSIKEKIENGYISDY